MNKKVPCENPIEVPMLQLRNRTLSKNKTKKLQRKVLLKGLFTNHVAKSIFFYFNVCCQTQSLVGEELDHARARSKLLNDS